MLVGEEELGQEAAVAVASALVEEACHSSWHLALPFWLQVSTLHSF